jgi:hypothetical protein
MQSSRVQQAVLAPAMCKVHGLDAWQWVRLVGSVRGWSSQVYAGHAAILGRRRYIHRSGRTGRAGKTGSCVMLYTPKKESYIPYIAKNAGVSFVRIGPPQPADIARSAAQVPIHRLLSSFATTLHRRERAASGTMEIEWTAQAVAVGAAGGGGGVDQDAGDGGGALFGHGQEHDGGERRPGTRVPAG